MKKRIILSLIIAGGFCLGTFLARSSGQVPTEREFTDFFDSQKGNESISNLMEKESPRIMDSFLKPEPQPDTVDIKNKESEIAPGPQKSLQKKEMVEIPASLPKVQIDASDFEDPFYRVRGFQENSKIVLQPGTTLDGVQFQSYEDSSKFIEKFYKESNFRLEDVYGKIEYLERRGGCYTCHQGIERISNNHRFSCVR